MVRRFRLIRSLQIIPSHPFIWVNDLSNKIVICPTNPQIALEKDGTVININYSLQCSVNSEYVETMDNQSFFVGNKANHL